MTTKELETFLNRNEVDLKAIKTSGRWYVCVLMRNVYQTELVTVIDDSFEDAIKNIVDNWDDEQMIKLKAYITRKLHG